MEEARERLERLGRERERELEEARKEQARTRELVEERARKAERDMRVR